MKAEGTQGKEVRMSADKKFVVCETLTGRYVQGKGRGRGGWEESSLFFVMHAESAAKFGSADTARGLADALPVLGLSGTYAVEELP